MHHEVPVSVQESRHGFLYLPAWPMASRNLPAIWRLVDVHFGPRLDFTLGVIETKVGI